MMIDKPGIYLDFPTADYFADPTPTPSLTQSIAKVLIDRSPAHAWIQHPRLNPNWQADDPTKYDIGNIAHKLLLGRGKEFAVLDFDDWRTKDAKAAREEAQARGVLAVLGKHYDIAGKMYAAAVRQLVERGFQEDWQTDGGDSEVVIAAEKNGIWLRAMIDRLTQGRRRVWDYKTTGTSASPYALDWRLVDGGWDVQAAMHEGILDVVDADNAGRREHLFVVQEDEEPFALTVMRLPEGVLTIGRKKVAAAVNMWTTCLHHNDWPAYPLDTKIASYPGAAESRWLEREITEAERAPRKTGLVLMGG